MEPGTILLILKLITGPGHEDKEIHIPMSTTDECADHVRDFLKSNPPDNLAPKILDAQCVFRLGART